MLQRLPKGILIGLVAWLIWFIIIAIISMLIPGVKIDASWWGGIIGLAIGAIYVVTGENKLT